MTRTLTPKHVDGITCYSESVANDYSDYPDSGFDLTDKYAETSFWVSSRNRLFSWLVHRERDRLGQASLLDVGCGTGDFAKHLTEDGVFILSVPQHMFLWSQLDEIVFHKRRYARSEMVNKLSQSEFTPVRVTSPVFALLPLMCLSRLLDKAKLSTAPDDGEALSDRRTFSPVVNWICNKIMYFDEALIKLGLSLPMVGTLVVVARKNVS